MTPSPHTPSNAALSRRAFVRLAFAGAAGAVAALSVAARGAAAAGEPATLAPARLAAADRSLTLSLFAATADQIKSIVQAPFEQLTGATLAFDVGTQGQRFNKLLAQRDSAAADVFFTGDEAVVAGYTAGVLTPVRRANVPNAVDLYDFVQTVAEGTSSSTLSGIPFGVLSFGLAYNTDLVSTPPQAWADLWDPAYAGKLALAGVGHTMMPGLVIVAAEQAGGDADNVDPGFGKLAELRPAKLTSVPSDWAPLEQTGEVTLVTEFDYYIQAFKDQQYPIEFVVPSDRALGVVSYAALVKGTQNADLAETFLNLLIDPGIQGSLAKLTYQGPVNARVQLDADLADRVAFGDRLQRVRFFDPHVFAANRAAWMERLNTQVVPVWGA